MKQFYIRISLTVLLLWMVQPVFVQAQSNQCLHFDKVDDFCQLVNGSQYVSGGNKLSMTGWFYCDALAYGQGYMGFRSGSGTAEFYLIQLNNGVMECRLVTTTGLHEYVAPANTVIPQVWQHFAWIFDGTSVKLYVNGILKGSHSASGNFVGTNVNFGIGKSLLGGFNFVYGGKIDEVSVWNKALSQTEIQDMMTNELTGTEANLQMYYKFNQGVPNGNNTSISKLICEVGTGERDADLLNFALDGTTSNFSCELDPGYQAISFPQIPPHLTTDAPFDIQATATSGLPVTFTVLSGPATVNGNTVTLTGQAGEVTIEASQPGNGQYDPADPVVNKFMVLDANTYVPVTEIRHPLAGNVYVPNLSKILLSAYSTIGYPELFHVSDVYFKINGETISGETFNNGHYIGWWTPPSYGNYTLTVESYNNYGAKSVQTANINIVATATDVEVVAAENVWLNPNNVSQVVMATMPSYLGAYNKIMGKLTVSCPSGGCGEWDRVASVDLKGHDGKWIEIIRYITPYKTACSHNIDLTDFASMLLGKAEFRFNCSTLDNGYLYKLTLTYTKGTPPYLYSSVNEIWNDIYPFGEYGNLQPVPTKVFEFPEDVSAAKLKLVSTGHGWGDLNTGNAAEFYEATHNIWVNGVKTFDQHNWYDCNPNPDACQPQSGTWYYNRAGWCPGAIAQWYDYNMNPYVSNGSVELTYKFYENYMDLCNPNHPNCVTGVTCSNCDDGFNPTLDVACNLIVFSENPLLTSTNDKRVVSTSRINIRPNPAHESVEVYSFDAPTKQSFPIQLMTPSGAVISQHEWDGKAVRIDLSDLAPGMYFLKIKTADRIEVKKLIVQ